MGLFKSKEEKRLERDMVARRALANFKRQIVQQDKHEKDYVRKAIRAKQLGDQRMLETLKAQIRRTHLMKYRFERSMLVLETAMRMGRGMLFSTLAEMDRKPPEFISERKQAAHIVFNRDKAVVDRLFRGRTF